MDPVTFTLPENSLYMLIAALFAAGIAIPSPIQPLFKALASIFYKKNEDTEPGKEGLISEKQAIDRLPELVRELTTLIVSSPDARGMIGSELIKLAMLTSAKAEGKLPDLLPAILALLTAENNKRKDLDLSQQLSESWAKVTGAANHIKSVDVPHSKGLSANVVKPL